MSKKLLALVKWVGGEDDRKYTVGVPVDWMKSFNYEKYLTTNEESTYVIEWHGSSKMPIGGWDCYDGYVIEVSDRLSYLNEKLNQIDGILSPTKAVNSATTTDEALKENEGDIEKNLPQNRSISNKGKASNNSQINGNVKKLNVVEKEVPPLMRTQRRLETDDTTRQKHNLMTDDESDIDEINSSSKLIKQMIQGNQKIEHQLVKVCKELRSQRKKRGRESSSGSSSDSDEEEPMTLWKHTKTFNATGLGISMNNKLNSLRRAEKIRATEAAQEPNPEDNP